jgi:hypothetical protein
MARKSAPQRTVGHFEMLQDEETGEQFVARARKAGMQAKVVGYGPGSGFVTVELGHKDPSVLRSFCDKEMGVGAYEEMHEPGTLATC